MEAALRGGVVVGVLVLVVGEGLRWSGLSSEY